MSKIQNTINNLNKHHPYYYTNTKRYKRNHITDSFRVAKMRRYPNKQEYGVPDCDCKTCVQDIIIRQKDADKVLYTKPSIESMIEMSHKLIDEFGYAQPYDFSFDHGEWYVNGLKLPTKMNLYTRLESNLVPLLNMCSLCHNYYVIDNGCNSHVIDPDLIDTVCNQITGPISTGINEKARALSHKKAQDDLTKAAKERQKHWDDIRAAEKQRIAMAQHEKPSKSLIKHEMTPNAMPYIETTSHASNPNFSWIEV